MEPPVRQRYLALLSVFASLPAMALTFQTRLENIEWTVEGDKFECRLTQPITDFGSGEFVRRPASRRRSVCLQRHARRRFGHLAGGGCAVAAGAWRHQSGLRGPAAATCCSTVRKARPAA
jgi:hypothetical protein